MQAETQGFGALHDFDDDALIPVELLPSEARKLAGFDSASINELGKQLLGYAKDGETDMVRDLMCRGAPFTTDWLGTSALHMAAQNNHIETAEVLLRAGISRDARTKVDRTPLHMAAYEGHAEMTQLLLNYGADVDARDMLRMTPLHWAVEQEHTDVINIILDYGADPNLVSKFNKTALNLAMEHDRMDIVDLLRREREIIRPTKNCKIDNDSAAQNLLILENENQRINLNRQHSEEREQKPTSNKKTRMVFKKIGDDDDKLKETDQSKKFRSTEIPRDLSHLVEQPFKFLSGITMLPLDNDSSIVENAMESGQTVVLTEAGKLALNLTRSPPRVNTKRLQVATKKVARNVIQIRPEQIINHSNPTMSKTPNILKRNSSGDAKGLNKFIITPTSNSASVTASIEFSPINTKKILMSNKDQNLPIICKMDKDSIVDGQEAINILLIQKKLTDAKKEAEELRKLLEKKEQEIENHEQMLNKMMNRRRPSK